MGKAFKAVNKTKLDDKVILGSFFITSENPLFVEYKLNEWVEPIKGILPDYGLFVLNHLGQIDTLWSCIRNLRHVAKYLDADYSVYECETVEYHYTPKPVLVFHDSYFLDNAKRNLYDEPYPERCGRVVKAVKLFREVKLSEFEPYFV
jgi:hypothetical protein